MKITVTYSVFYLSNQNTLARSLNTHWGLEYPLAADVVPWIGVNRARSHPLADSYFIPYRIYQMMKLKIWSPKFKRKHVSIE